MNSYLLNSIENKYFQECWKIYQKSFPKEEKRFIHEQEKILKDSSYNACAYLNNDKVIGFIFYWQLEEYIFIEHFAIHSEYRGNSFGSKILKEFLINKNNVILEIEKIVDDVTLKRYQFYKRFDFYMNKYLHYQIPFREKDIELELLLLSYKKELTNFEYEKVYKNMKIVLSKNIYNSGDFL